MNRCLSLCDSDKTYINIPMYGADFNKTDEIKTVSFENKIISGGRCTKETWTSTEK